MTKAQKVDLYATYLVKEAKAGNKAAFGELVKRYRRRIYALTLHLTGNEADADDVAQEVFLTAYRKLHQFAGRSEFFTWVYRVAVNRSLNAKRDRARRRERSLEDPRLEMALAVDARGNPARACELRQTYQRLLDALDQLPGPMRTTVVLVALQGLSQGEAAVVQDCSEGTIAWRMHQARKKLARALAVAEVAPAGEREPAAEMRLLLQKCGLPGLAG